MSMMEYYEREQERRRRELLWPKEDPLLRKHFNMPLNITEEGTPDNPVYTVTQKLLAEVVDSADEAIVQAIIREAERAGVSDLCLIDREYILDALRLKRESGKAADCTQCCYKQEFEKLMALPSCNDCIERTRNRCGCAPRVGEFVRINCPMWSSEKEDDQAKE